MKVRLSQQVVDFVSKLSPQPRRQIRHALRILAREQGDIKALEGELSNFYRLRIGSYRVIFRYQILHHHRIISCEYINRRPIVYQLFAHVAYQLR
ncbi:MAG: hypothetical protein K1X66_04440 [Verrucomicrobiae bacterium]|nr:hypothetical protein [Verrucomicrobiae bacterium]